jgi:hypothetical protein
VDPLICCLMSQFFLIYREIQDHWQTSSAGSAGAHWNHWPAEEGYHQTWNNSCSDIALRDSRSFRTTVRSAWALNSPWARAYPQKKGIGCGWTGRSAKASAKYLLTPSNECLGLETSSSRPFASVQIWNWKIGTVSPLQCQWYVWLMPYNFDLVDHIYCY